MANQVRHLGIIMDGNRRWAKKHMLTSVIKGHEMGVNTYIDACKWAKAAGIPYVTVYAFSTENWNRAREEVAGLFKLMGKFYLERIDECLEEGMRMIFIGDRTLVAPEDRETMRKIEETTAHCDKLTVLVALSYGGRDEIVRAVRAYTEKVRAGQADPDKLTEEEFSSYLDTAGYPDMDLVIRTGGNRRLSNFFPWQTTYAEIYFTDVLWPDFSQKDLQEALDYYEQIQINKGR